MTTVTVTDIALAAGPAAYIQFIGTPPQVSSYDASLLPASTPVLTNQYFVALKVPGLEISSVESPQRIQEFLAAFTNELRQLVVSSQPPTNRQPGILCMYKYDLPAHTPLGISFTGFPPKISDVAPTSPLFQKVYPGQFVHTMTVPQRLELSVNSPGFTGARILQELGETNHIEGRQLVVKDSAVMTVPQRPELSVNSPGFTGAPILQDLDATLSCVNTAVEIKQSLQTPADESLQTPADDPGCGDLCDCDCCCGCIVL
jgi:hypothetical protein